MESAVLQSEGDIVIESRPKPEPKGKEIRVKVKRSGICMTDVHIKNGAFSVSDPIVLGHEFSGIVDGIGPNSERFDLGDKVAANPIISCGYCNYCQDGRTNFCENATVLGGAGEDIIDGGFQEYTIVPQKNLEKLKNDESFARGAFAEPLGCAIRGINRLQINPGDEVLLIGAGPMGLLLLQLLKQQGVAKVIVSELIDERRKLALDLGAEYAFSPEEVSILERVKDLSNNNDGVDVAVEAVGTENTARTGVDALRRGGRMLVFGVPPEEAEIPVNIFETYYDEKDIFGSFALTRKDFLEAISLINNDQLELEGLVSHQLELENLDRGIELAQNGKGLKKQIEL